MLIIFFAKLGIEFIIALVVLLVAQYILAVYALNKLIHTSLPVKKILGWNFFILFVFFVGPIIGIIKSKSLPPFQPSVKPIPEEKDSNDITSTKTETDNSNNNISSNSVSADALMKNYDLTSNNRFSPELIATQESGSEVKSDDTKPNDDEPEYMI